MLLLQDWSSNHKHQQIPPLSRCMKTILDGASNPICQHSLLPPAVTWKTAGRTAPFAGQPLPRRAGGINRRLFFCFLFFDESLLAQDEDKQHMSPLTPPSRRTRVTVVADAAN